MKTFSIIFLFLGLSVSAQVKTLPLWPEDKIPNHQQSTEKEEINDDDVVWISKVQKPTLEVYLPVKQSATGQAVLICPGGGYAGLAYDWEGTQIAKFLNSKGIAAGVLKYRLPLSASIKESFKAPLQDAQRGIRLLRANASAWHIDKNKVGVMGFSAGGHLASTLGTHFQEAMYSGIDITDSEEMRPDFMVLIYPVISMDSAITHQGSHDNLLGKNPSAALEEQFSNELQVTKNTPETFILHAGDDGAVPVENSLRMYAALQKNGIKTEMHIYPEGEHGFALANGKYYLENWSTRLIDWLKNLK
ncbi:alpha/beta hydrolase [Zunongwangia endophytica]|uniref:Alpha/beta hydrolase n=1 Tax=Zunongwangia endophytica TaxID=1808945 RepID=A0ABV8HA75_9FLAO|nr:alpha/beta hydrolase [Zunongwangia endophytica]MDN3595342.1 alpha/beta hydrolase [Zunongwangia endophytica]